MRPEDFGVWIPGIAPMIEPPRKAANYEETEASRTEVELGGESLTARDRGSVDAKG